MEQLREKIRKMVLKEMNKNKGSALLTGNAIKRPTKKGTKKASRKLLSASALINGNAMRRKKTTKKGTKKKAGAIMAGKLKLAKKSVNVVADAKKTRGAPRGNSSALVEINKIAKQLKKKNPNLEHKMAISRASAMYRKQR